MSEDKKDEQKLRNDNKFIHIRLSEENTAEINSICSEIGKNVKSELVNALIKGVKRDKKLKIAQKLTKVDKLAEAMKDPVKRKAIQEILNGK